MSVLTTKDENDRVTAYIEYRQVGQSGFDKLYGEYVFINDFWITPDLRGDKGIFKSLVSRILRKCPDAIYCYFVRKKYGGRMSKIYKRDYFERLVNKGVSYGW